MHFDGGSLLAAAGMLGGRIWSLWASLLRLGSAPNLLNRAPMAVVHCLAAFGQLLRPFDFALRRTS
jgi:hypothetical protein